jgi:hypothetical protein
MYTSCNGATRVYACCIVVRARICGKIQFLALGIAKRGLQVCMEKWKRPSEQVAWGKTNISITIITYISYCREKELCILFIAFKMHKDVDNHIIDLKNRHYIINELYALHSFSRSSSITDSYKT